MNDFINRRYRKPKHHYPYRVRNLVHSQCLKARVIDYVNQLLRIHVTGVELVNITPGMIGLNNGGIKILFTVYKMLSLASE